MNKQAAKLKEALEFLDRCRKDKSAVETGALRDAHEWVESAARDVVADALITAAYGDKRSRGQPQPQPR